MYDRRFFQTKLGQAAMVSMTAMAVLIATSSQIAANPAVAATQIAQCDMVELA